MALVFAMGGTRGGVQALPDQLDPADPAPSVAEGPARRQLAENGSATELRGKTQVPTGENRPATGPARAGTEPSAGYLDAARARRPIYITVGQLQQPRSTISAKALPAGNFIVSATVQVDLRSTASGGYGAVTCSLADGSAGQAETFTSAAQPLGTGSYGASGSIPLSIGVSSSQGASTVVLNCASSASSGSPLTFDATNAAISAVQTSYNG